MDTTTVPGPEEQSAAAPSPFPPIADYGFLSDCHTVSERLEEFS